MAQDPRVKRVELGERPRTEPMREVKRRLRLVPPEPAADGRPRTRAECANVPRPCPYVSCRYHLYLDITFAGGIKYNHPEREPDELTESCALDVADRGGDSLERVGELLNITHERVRQIEERAKARLRLAYEEDDEDYYR